MESLKQSMIELSVDFMCNDKYISCVIRNETGEAALFTSKHIYNDIFEMVSLSTKYYVYDVSKITYPVTLFSNIYKCIREFMMLCPDELVRKLNDTCYSYIYSPAPVRNLSSTINQLESASVGYFDNIDAEYNLENLDCPAKPNDYIEQAETYLDQCKSVVNQYEIQIEEVLNKYERLDTYVRGLGIYLDQCKNYINQHRHGKDSGTIENLLKTVREELDKLRLNYKKM